MADVKLEKKLTLGWDILSKGEPDKQRQLRRLRD